MVAAVTHTNHIFEKLGDRTAVANPKELDTTDEVSEEVAMPAVNKHAGTKGFACFANRLTIMTEVAVSKIFPAGFGWQLASCYAGAAGFAGDSLAFAVSTGCGDFLGVALGHTGYYIAKKTVYDKTIDVSAQAQTGVFLASAAFLSGTAWQPALNLFQGASLSFDASVGLTGAVCGGCFFGGLRLGRLFYSNIFPAVAPPNYANLKGDASLSVAIGGATGSFVGTDVSYGDANWLRPYWGIEDGMSDIHGAALAGTSTAAGFTAVQMGQNVTMPKGKNWID